MIRDQSEAVAAALALPPRGRILLIGAVDTGKTTLAATLLRALQAAGALPVAVVDADLGQSEIGAPGTVGLGVLAAEASAGELPGTPRALSRLPCAASAFVGTTGGATGASLSATVRMIQAAALMEPRPARVVIDTPGHVTGSGAAYLRAVIEITRPHLVIALERGAELDPLLRPLPRWPETQIARCPPLDGVGHKTGGVRATRRAARFAEHLRGARELTLSWGAGDAPPVVLENTAISYGAALPPHELRFIGQTLRAECVHAERSAAGHVLAVVRGRAATRPDSLAMLQEPLRAARVTLASADTYDGLLCGLHNPRGDLLGIGLITALEFARETLTLLTPVRPAGAVARVTLGAVRLRPDGREIEVVRPGAVG